MPLVSGGGGGTKKAEPDDPPLMLTKAQDRNKMLAIDLPHQLKHTFTKTYSWHRDECAISKLFFQLKPASKLLLCVTGDLEKDGSQEQEVSERVNRRVGWFKYGRRIINSVYND